MTVRALACGPGAIPKTRPPRSRRVRAGCCVRRCILGGVHVRCGSRGGRRFGAVETFAVRAYRPRARYLHPDRGRSAFRRAPSVYAVYRTSRHAVLITHTGVCPVVLPAPPGPVGAWTADAAMQIVVNPVDETMTMLCVDATGAVTPMARIASAAARRRQCAPPPATCCEPSHRSRTRRLCT